MHHSFDINLATRYSIEEAILIHHFQHWIGINKRMGKNLHEGRTWMFQTQKRITAHFPYFKNKLHVFRLIEKLVEHGILIKGNFNRSKFDRTNWYAFKDEEKFLHGVEFDPNLEEKDEENEPELKKCFRDFKNETSTFQNGNLDVSKVKHASFESETPIPNTKENILKKELLRSSKETTTKSNKIIFDSHACKFEGITSTDMDEWRKIYFRVNIDLALIECAQWARSAKRDNYRKSINSWLRNKQENVVKTSQEIKNEIEEKKQENFTDKDIEKNKKQAEVWEEALHKKGTLHYTIYVKIDKIIFILPESQSVEIEYAMTHESFLKRCEKVIKKLNI